MSGFQEFGFGSNDERIGKKDKRFKMVKGEEARVSFLWWPGLAEGTPNFKAATPTFVGGLRHYVKGVGYFMNKGPEYTNIAGDAPKMRINTIIVKWPLKKDSSGNMKLDVEAIQLGNVDVLYWIFDGEKYDEIKPIHAEWHLGECDLKIKCSDAQYQKMAFSPTKESVLAKLAEKPDNDTWKKIIAAAQDLLATVEAEVGRDMSLDQIREKLAAAGVSPGGGGSSNSGAGMGAVSEEMDDALEKFLG